MLARFALSVAFLVLTAATPPKSEAPIDPCCGIVSVNSLTGVALVRNNATGKIFLIALTTRSLLGSFRVGTPVAFSKSTGLVIRGFAPGSVRIVRPPKGGGKVAGGIVDCALTPQACPNGKPDPKITKEGGTTWDDVIDYCYDEIQNCVDNWSWG